MFDYTVQFLQTKINLSSCRHKNVWEKGNLAPLVLNLGCWMGWVMNFTAYRFNLSVYSHWVGGWVGPESRFRCFREEINLLPVHGIDPRHHGHPVFFSQKTRNSKHTVNSYIHLQKKTLFQTRKSVVNIRCIWLNKSVVNIRCIWLNKSVVNIRCIWPDKSVVNIPCIWPNKSVVNIPCIWLNKSVVNIWDKPLF